MKTAPLRDEGGISRSEEDMFCGRLAWLHHIIQSEGMIREKKELQNLLYILSALPRCVSGTEEKKKLICNEMVQARFNLA